MTEHRSPDLTRLSAAQMLAGYAAGDFTPEDTVDACLARIVECQSAFNAFVHVDAEGARSAARASAQRWAGRGPLGAMDGVPVSVKDNLNVAGMPTTWGSKLLHGYIAPHDELPVARLRASGAVMVGKTNVPEFAMQGHTNNLVAGATRNPWNPAMTPGGSSGGAAASVAAGCVPLALATDGGGSTRRPASHCGLVGFKPSAGWVARGNGLPELFLDFEAIGGIGRTVEDVRLLMSAIASSDSLTGTKRSRILHVPRFGDSPVDPRISAQVLDASERFKSNGHAVVEAAHFDLADDVNTLWPALSGAGLAWLLEDPGHFRAVFGHDPDVSLCTPATRAILERGSGMKASGLFELLNGAQALIRRLSAEIFSKHDFVLTPCTAALPWSIDETHPSMIAGHEVGPRAHAVFTALANAAGLPAIALPTGLVDGLPTGVQVIGRRGADARVLAIAQQFEQAHPWSNKRPAS